jgi:hypothetical protein
MPVTLTCQVCFTTFQVEPFRKDTAKFCSNACKRIARRNALELECQSCGNSFIVRAYRKDTASFCSRACKRQAMLLAPEHNRCLECGKDFLVSRGQRANKGNRFCSRKCSGIYTGREKLGQALHTFWDRVRCCEHGWDCLYCCWPWEGTLDLNGYGRIIVATKQTYAHRAAWELGNKQTLAEDREAAHWCHQTDCCNWMHLHSATHKENMQDSVRDKRHAFGERNGHSKMTEDKAIIALRLHADGWSLVRIATHLSIPDTAIEALCNGRSWKHLPRPPRLSRQVLLFPF